MHSLSIIVAIASKQLTMDKTHQVEFENCYKKLLTMITSVRIWSSKEKVEHEAMNRLLIIKPWLRNWQFCSYFRDPQCLPQSPAILAKFWFKYF